MWCGREVENHTSRRAISLQLLAKIYLLFSENVVEEKEEKEEEMTNLFELSI